MTAQFAEVLRYQGEELAMCSQPLDDYLELAGSPVTFESNCTALWRGYIGTWEIVEARLYLIGLQGNLSGGGEASLATLFPDFPDRVFAHWFSGQIRIPQGRQLEYVHMGYGSVFKRDLLLDLEHGVVTGSQIRMNGTSHNLDAAQQYGVGAMTVFPRGGQDQTGER